MPNGPSRSIALDGIGLLLFVKSRRARRITLTVPTSPGVRAAVPTRALF